jgi:hypothetical protein
MGLPVGVHAPVQLSTGSQVWHGPHDIVDAPVHTPA